MQQPELVVDLLRHAHSYMNAEMADQNRVPFIGGRQNHVDIDSRGEREAKQFGRDAKKYGLIPTRVICSPAKRTRRTYEVAAGEMGLKLKPKYDDRLQELDQGSWTNQPRTLYDDHREEMDRLGWDFAPLDGESMRMVAKRGWECIKEVEPTPGATKPEYLWIVTHGVLIKNCIGDMLGWSHEKTYKTAIDNVSRTRIARFNGVWKHVFTNKLTFDD